MNVTPQQLRAAGALLDWTQGDLTTAPGIAAGSVKNFEGGLTDANPRTIIAPRKALEDAGAILLAPGDVRRGGAEVRLRDGDRSC